MVLYLFFLGVALAFLVEGTTLAREVGGVLLVICLVIGVRLSASVSLIPPTSRPARRGSAARRPRRARCPVPAASAGRSSRYRSPAPGSRAPRAEAIRTARGGTSRRRGR